MDPLISHAMAKVVGFLLIAVAFCYVAEGATTCEARDAFYEAASAVRHSTLLRLKLAARTSAASSPGITPAERKCIGFQLGRGLHIVNSEFNRILASKIFNEADYLDKTVEQIREEDEARIKEDIESAVSDWENLITGCLA